MSTITNIVSRSRAREVGRARGHNIIQNTSITSSSGALGLGDRGAFGFLPFDSGNPYNSQDYVWRWRQYVQMYETCWEARKIVRIIVEDALRKDWIIEDLPEEMQAYLSAACEKLRVLQAIKKSAILERLLGGCLTFLGLDGAEKELGDVFHPLDSISKLRFLNAIPVSRISRVDWCHDPYPNIICRRIGVFVYWFWPVGLGV